MLSWQRRKLGRKMKLRAWRFDAARFLAVIVAIDTTDLPQDKFHTRDRSTLTLGARHVGDAEVTKEVRYEPRQMRIEESQRLRRTGRHSRSDAKIPSVMFVRCGRVSPKSRVEPAEEERE